MRQAADIVQRFGTQCTQCLADSGYPLQPEVVAYQTPIVPLAAFQHTLHHGSGVAVDVECLGRNVPKEVRRELFYGWCRCHRCNSLCKGTANLLNLQI